MLFSRPGSLAYMLRRTSHLAWCDEFLYSTNRRYKKSYNDYDYDYYHLILPIDVKNWAFDMFCMGPDRRYDDDIGTIAHWMRTKYPELFDEILSLSSKLEKKIYDNKNVLITSTDWDLMHNGIERYRRYLLNKTCDCF